MKNIEDSDWSSEKLYPFKSSFDEVVEDIRVWATAATCDLRKVK